MKMNIILFFLYSFTNFTLFAKQYSCPMEKKLPYYVNNCEGESCGTYYLKRILADTTLYKEPYKTSNIIGKIKKCERFLDIAPVRKIYQLERAEVIKGTVSTFKKGDIITILGYSGEGELQVCMENGEHTTIHSDNIKYVNYINPKGVILPYESSHLYVPKEKEDWVKIKTLNGQIGYAPNKRQKIRWRFIEYRLEPEKLKSLERIKKLYCETTSIDDIDEFYSNMDL